ncbi:MAG: ubiquinone/menaquinone biosynthesis methyltransferase [Actinomycetota bacterium]
MRTHQEPLPTGQEKVTTVRAMFDRVAPRYDLVNRVMTFGMDRGWRKAVVKAMAPRTGSTVLDIACGTGDFCRELQRVGCFAVGFDLSIGMLDAAQTDAPLVQADALALPVKDHCASGITCGFALRNVIDIPALLGEFARALEPGGVVGVLEVAAPRSRVIGALHGAYFKRVVPLIGGLLSDRDAYRYLPRSTAYLPSYDELDSMFKRAGFVDVQRRLLGLGAAQMVIARRP